MSDAQKLMNVVYAAGRALAMPDDKDGDKTRHCVCWEKLQDVTPNRAEMEMVFAERKAAGKDWGDTGPGPWDEAEALLRALLAECSASPAQKGWARTTWQNGLTNE
jgi:hypothetical protein